MLKIWSQVQKTEVGVFFRDMKDLLLSKYEDKWAREHAEVLQTPPLRLLCLFGQLLALIAVHMLRAEAEAETQSITSSITAQTGRHSPLKPNDTLKSQLIISPYLVMF